jgi:hypothetical protein
MCSRSFSFRSHPCPSVSLDWPLAQYRLVQPLSTSFGPARCVALLPPPRPQVEERRRVLSCECQFVIGSYMFPEDLRDPESSTCPAEFSIPVDAGGPHFF